MVKFHGSIPNSIERNLTEGGSDRDKKPWIRAWIKSVKGNFLMVNQVMAVRQAGMIRSAGVLTPEKTSQTVRKTYPNYKVIVLNDDENTFEHVVATLVRYIPGMVADHAWKLADQVHQNGQAIVWTGPMEQAELYHMQLTLEGLTMAPLEAS